MNKFTMQCALLLLRPCFNSFNQTSESQRWMHGLLLPLAFKVIMLSTFCLVTDPAPSR